ncbi:GNAT family N-acetyltransferase [Shewanella avicenniae]|uniref:GNAT family N-acetyltransferase n=1 Tax=Shewanella avicenniae TaxID=2814294 RepID=A0ABX7QS45_9GAMM|nr:GNAT family protein [Shewanella avicenniae]QSX34224.1 GNAT family N-acetyltransferase [Shewanella avicenniae]
MDIIKASLADVPRMLAIYQHARQFMAANGNAQQWGDGYPAQAQLEQDIAKGHSYLCVDNGTVIATFYFAIEEEPTYQMIEDGTWLNARPYGVLHRIAVQSDKKGIATFCLNWCFELVGNMRIDTHEQNLPMRRVLEKLGYQYCGVIYVRDGSARLAYQKS